MLLQLYRTKSYSCTTLYYLRPIEHFKCVCRISHVYVYPVKLKLTLCHGRPRGGLSRVIQEPYQRQRDPIQHPGLATRAVIVWTQLPMSMTMSLSMSTSKVIIT